MINSKVVVERVQPRSTGWFMSLEELNLSANQYFSSSSPAFLCFVIIVLPALSSKRSFFSFRGWTRVPLDRGAERRTDGILRLRKSSGGAESLVRDYASERGERCNDFRDCIGPHVRFPFTSPPLHDPLPWGSTNWTRNWWGCSLYLHNAPIVLSQAPAQCANISDALDVPITDPSTHK